MTLLHFCLGSATHYKCLLYYRNWAEWQRRETSGDGRWNMRLTPTGTEPMDRNDDWWLSGTKFLIRTMDFWETLTGAVDILIYIFCMMTDSDRSKLQKMSWSYNVQIDIVETPQYIWTVVMFSGTCLYHGVSDQSYFRSCSCHARYKPVSSKTYSLIIEIGDKI